MAAPDGSNEVGAIPGPLRTLDSAGAIVTIDAAGCQVGNARLMRGRGGHYPPAVEETQPTLRAAVERVAAAAAADFAGVPLGEAAEGGHVRQEERHASVFGIPAGIPAGWPEVAAVVRVTREREVGGTNTGTAHYYLTSHAGAAAEVAGFVRGHWGVENAQSDDPRSDNLCASGRAGYDLPGGPSRAGRVVPPARGPRRPLMRLDSPARVPPRPRRHRTA